MKTIADICIVPIGVGVSLGTYIAAAVAELEAAGLKTEVHAYGTNVEGEYDAVFAALRRCLERIHAMGAPRITCTVKLGTRTDREQTMEDKVLSVRSQLSARGTRPASGE
jgi:uncharacterized protein (TIGR00106 family)